MVKGKSTTSLVEKMAEMRKLGAAKS